MVEPAGQAASRTSRRAVLKGAAMAGLAVPVLSACANSTDAGAGSSSSASGTGEASGGGGSASRSPGAASSSQGGTTGLVSTSKVPVGGGTVLTDAQVVVTQPTKGEFRGFSSICTHQGCPVATVAQGTIQCPCHGSLFSIKDGAVVGGPAPRPLPAVRVEVQGDEVVRA